MVVRLRSAACVLFMLGYIGPVCAQGTNFHQGSTYQKIAEHGKQIVLGYYYDLDPDCASRGNFSIYVTDPPQGGSVSFEQTKDFPTYSQGDPRAKCDLRRVNVTKVFYRARSNFIGNDNFGLQAVTSSGNAINFNIQVTVR